MSVWRLAHGRSLDLSSSGIVMGILNVTPDSFSDGGRHADVAGAVDAALAMAAEGAAIIDIGGESTRPDATPVDAEQERARVLPVIQTLAAREKILISVDTYRACTAKAAIAAGAHIVNDVTAGLADDAMLPFVRDGGVGYVAMHNSRSEYCRQREGDPVADQCAFARVLQDRLRAAGVAEDQVVFDPGIGFGKDAEENLVLLRNLRSLVNLGFPLLLGTSRKRFLGALTGRAADERDSATVATTVLGRQAGAHLFRVHDVASNRDALSVTDAILQAKELA